MNSEDVKALLAEKYAETGTNDFVVKTTENDFRSMLTSLRHLKAKGAISDYHIVSEQDCEVEVLGYVA